MTRKHSHYFKSVAHLQDIDVYRVLHLFGVTDQALGHSAKKILVAGGRGSKDMRKDIQEAIDTLQRKLEMMDEDAVATPHSDPLPAYAPAPCKCEKLCVDGNNAFVECLGKPRSRVYGG